MERKIVFCREIIGDPEDEVDWEDLPEDEEELTDHHELPEDEDCSSDILPADMLEGKRKVFVPDLVSMSDILFDRRRRDMYFFLCRCLRNGKLESLVGCRIMNSTINGQVCRFPYVNYWQIDREEFYADVSVELTLRTVCGVKTWRGFLVCWCSFGDDLSIEIEELVKSPLRQEEDFVPLSKYLLPVKKNKKVDQIAEEMWEEYCKEALFDPGMRNAEMLAEKMGLNIIHCPVYEHRGVDSIVFFKEDVLSLGLDRTEKTSDGKKRRKKTKKPKPETIPADTIVINSNKICRDYSAFNIYHECYHFKNHYMFYRLQELASNDLRQVPMKEILVKKGEVVKDPVYFMEKQADRGGMGLMMPATHTGQLIWEELGKVTEFRHSGDRYDTAGTEMRKLLSLPEFRIRMRMIQLGHFDAKGALNYVDGDKIEAFAFDHEAWAENEQTFVISEREVKGLCHRNEDFRIIMMNMQTER